MSSGSHIHSPEVFKFIHNFVPHPHKKTRARLINHTALIMYSIILVIALGVFSLVPKIYPGVLGYATDIRIKELFDTTNTIRGDSGLEPLRLNPTLSRAARRKAEDMFKNDYWAHISPTGVEPWYFILDEGYDYSYAGENLAKNFNTSKEVVGAWYQSPSHKDNLLNSNYEEVGFAVVHGVLEGYETTLVVQMFGKPRNPELLATLAEQESLLDEFESMTTNPTVVQVPASGAASSTVNTSTQQVPVEKSNVLSINILIKYLTVGFGLFLVILLLLDIYHTKKKGILKFTGHTSAHILFLVLVIVAIVFVINPGTIL